jgi:hypothetical protein
LILPWPQGSSSLAHLPPKVSVDLRLHFCAIAQFSLLMTQEVDAKR